MQYVDEFSLTLTVFSGQFIHIVALVLAEYVPVAQFVHIVAPTLAEYVPIGQSIQLAELIAPAMAE